MARVRRHRVIACWLIIAAFGGYPAVALGLKHAPSPPTAPSCTSACRRLEGLVRSAGDRIPVAQARIIAIPAKPGTRPGRVRTPPADAAAPAWQEIATTDALGRFVFAALPTGSTRLVVVAPGFERLDQVVAIGPAPLTTTKLFPRPAEDATYRTVVAPARPRRSAPTRRVLSRKELLAMPGTQGDPLRALQNLPGVGRAPASVGLLVLRGAAPGQSGVFVGGHAVPRAFHLLSLASVLPTEVIRDLEFVPGNFDAAWGNATGGVVVVEPRAGRRDGYHGHGKVDLAAAGALVEGPVGRGSFIVAAQRGYIDAIVAAADAATERATGQTQNLLRPAYYDYQAMFDYPVGPGDFGVRIFGAGDRLRGARSEASEFEFRSDFHRVDLVWRAGGSNWQTRLIPSFRFEVNRFNASSDSRRRLRRDYIVGARVEFERRFSRRFSWLVGSDFEVDPFVASDDRRLSLSGEQEIRETEKNRGVESAIGVYSTAQLRLGRFTLRPGVRASAFTVGSQRAFSVDPRSTLHVDLGEAWRLDFGLGLYSQVRAARESEVLDLLGQGTGVEGGSLFFPPVFSRLDPQVGFSPADVSIATRRAIHASAGVRYSFGDGWSLGATGFLREQDNGTPVFFQATVITSSSRARTYGIEVLLRKQLTRRLFGWIAYTLMRADVRFHGIDGVDTRRASDFDQRHNLIVLASYALPRRWQLGGRFRVVSGYPFTPVIGSINVAQGISGPILGRRNSDRLAAFHQLDLRLDKRWIRPRTTFTGYIEVQNVYNAQNAEAVIYSADFRDTVGVVGVPIFPVLGFRVDF